MAKKDHLATVSPSVVQALKARYRTAYIAGAVVFAIAGIVLAAGLLITLVLAGLGAGVGAAALFGVDLLRTGQESVEIRGSTVRRQDIVSYGKSKIR